MPATTNPLGSFLKDRRTKLDPATFGFSLEHRRTPGLRREEVALRANVSTTWYTWLEQGRGGAPSCGLLERIAQALMLTNAEREHLFLLAVGHVPKARYQAVEGITPRLQRVLDALEYSPALIRTATWDVVAWNRATTVVWTDYAKLEPTQRNILRMVFCTTRARDMQSDWASVARHVVTEFRADVLRAGATRDVDAPVDELCHRSPEFNAMRNDSDVGRHSTGIKHLRHSTAGTLALEFSTFAVDGRPDLSLMVFNPATADDTRRLKALVENVTSSGDAQSQHEWLLQRVSSSAAGDRRAVHAGNRQRTHGHAASASVG